jgi:hypothetical protein
LELLVHIVEEREHARENEDVDGGGGAQQQNYFALARFGNRGGWLGIWGVQIIQIVLRGQIKARAANHKPAPQRNLPFCWASVSPVAVQLNNSRIHNSLR